MKTKTINDEIVTYQEPDVLYLKSKIWGLEAMLYMTDRRIYLDADDTNVMARGVYQYLHFLKDKLQTTAIVFDLEFSAIASIARGKQGFNNNVLEITDKSGKTWRTIVKDYQLWEERIKAKL